MNKHNGRWRYFLAIFVTLAMSVYALALYLFPIQSSYKSLAATFAFSFIILGFLFFIFYMIVKIMRKGGYRRKTVKIFVILYIALGISAYFGLANRLHDMMLAPKLAMIGLQDGKVTIRKSCDSVQDNPVVLEEPDQKKFPVLGAGDAVQAKRAYTIAFLQAIADSDATMAKIKPLNKMDEITRLTREGNAFTSDGRVLIRTDLENYCQFLGHYYNTVVKRYVTQYKTSYYQPENDPNKLAKITNMHNVFDRYLKAIHGYVAQEAKAIDLNVAYLDFMEIAKYTYSIKDGKTVYHSAINLNYHNQFIAAMLQTGLAEKARMDELRLAEAALKTVQY